MKDNEKPYTSALKRAIKLVEKAKQLVLNVRKQHLIDEARMKDEYNPTK